MFANRKALCKHNKFQLLINPCPRSVPSSYSPRRSPPYHTVNTVNPGQREDSSVFGVVSAFDKCSVV